MKVIGSASLRTVDVLADATGLSSRAGTALLALVAQRLGLTDGLSTALAGTRQRRSAHDPGRVLCDLAVMAADGGRCVSDLAVLQGQPALFGEIASVSTARRVLLSIGQNEIEGIRRARALARGRAWKAPGDPERVILDFDATPISIHSEKGTGGRALQGQTAECLSWSGIARCSGVLGSAPEFSGLVIGETGIVALATGDPTARGRFRGRSAAADNRQRRAATHQRRCAPGCS